MANTSAKTKSKADEENLATNNETEMTPIVPKEIDPEQYVTVRNGFHGRLLYKSSRTGERFVWPSFGDEQEIQLRELRNAKNSSKKFFINNWFMFDDAWVVDYLGVRQYYKHAISIDHFDDIFKQPVDKLKKMILEMTPGQRRSIAYRAAQLISENEIDSRKTISALEEALGVELIEK